MRTGLQLAAAALAALAAPAAATLGFDVPGPIDPTTAKCLVDAGYEFAIIRGWRSLGSFDPYVASTMANLWAAGIGHADVYMFPCAGQYAQPQVDQFLTDLQQSNVSYGMVWIDLEQNPSPGCAWNTDLADNCLYMKELSNALNARNVSWGVYSTPWEWQNVMGGDACVDELWSSRPIWYANPDKQPNFDDWAPFGGWTTPAIKQFDWYQVPCGLNIDSDWYP